MAGVGDFHRSLRTWTILWFHDLQSLRILMQEIEINCVTHWHILNGYNTLSQEVHTSGNNYFGYYHSAVVKCQIDTSPSAGSYKCLDPYAETPTHPQFQYNNVKIGKHHNRKILSHPLKTRKQSVRPYVYYFPTWKNKDNIWWTGYEVTWVKSWPKS